MNQRDAVYRRHVGAVDHLYGGRAAGSSRYRVDLPASSAKPQPRPEKPVFLSVKADKQLYVGDQPVNADQLTSVLDQRTQANKETTIFFQADKSVDYETLMSVMDTLRKAGYLKVGLVGMEGAAK